MNLAHLANLVERFGFVFVLDLEGKAAEIAGLPVALRAILRRVAEVASSCAVGGDCGRGERLAEVAEAR